MLKTLFLHPPSFEGFDGGAGSRYQARREIRSFWYPTWLAQPAALVPGSRLVDAPARGLTLDDVLPMADDYELAVLHTSTPSFKADVRVAEALKARNPRLSIGMGVADVAEEMRKAQAYFPHVKEYFFDDDTFTDDLPRAEAIAKELGKLGITWSCNAKGNVPYESLKILKDNGLRLFVVGYESGNQQ